MVKWDSGLFECLEIFDVVEKFGTFCGEDLLETKSTFGENN